MARQVHGHLTSLGGQALLPCHLADEDLGPLDMQMQRWGARLLDLLLDERRAPLKPTPPDRVSVSGSSTAAAHGDVQDAQVLAGSLIWQGAMRMHARCARREKQLHLPASDSVCCAIRCSELGQPHAASLTADPVLCTLIGIPPCSTV